MINHDSIQQDSPLAPGAGLSGKALVTGANGFIASALALRLLESGMAVRALCRDTRNGAHLQARGAELMQGDVQDAARMRQAVAGCDTVFHVAATFRTSPPVHYRVNVMGTLNIAGAALAAGVSRFVHVSSIAVYGLGVSGIIGEDHPKNPSDFDYYQQSKHIGEERLWEFALKEGLPTAVIRPAMVYGPGSGFWSGSLYQLVKTLPFVPQFAGDAHPIFIDDVVDMMLVLAKHPGAVGEAFNCAPDPSIPWTVYLGALAEIAGNTAKVRFPTRQLAPLGLAVDWIARFTGAPQDIANSLRFVDTRAVFSMQKAKDRLGWAPRISLAEGMKATEPWLLQEFGTRETAGEARS